MRWPPPTPLTDEQSRLADSHYRLAHWYARRQARGRPEMAEEFADCAIDALINSARAFDPSRGFRFGSLLRSAVASSIAARLRHLGHARRRPPSALLSLDSIEVAAPPGPDPDDGQPPDFDAMTSGLPGRERAVLQFRFRDGLKLLEVAERLGVTKQRVWQIQGRALLRLAAARNENPA